VHCQRVHNLSSVQLDVHVAVMEVDGLALTVSLIWF